MAKIMVVDDEAIVREPIAESIRAHGHLVTCASDGSAALAAIVLDAPDVILLDIRIPGQDGITLLRELRTAPLTAAIPVIFLTNASDRASILEVAKLKASGYILKSAFSLDDLLNRIARITGAKPDITPATAASERSRNVPPARSALPTRASAQSVTNPPSPPDVSKWPRLLSNDQTMQRLEEIAGGSTLAGVVSQLLAVSNSPESTLSDVVRIIQSDPILAARVLRMANSASSGSRGRVHDVEDAARNLGVRAIQNLAITIGIVGAFPPDERDGFNIMRCWQHSYAVAQLFDTLLKGAETQKSSSHHLVGLCHELGEILLRQHFADEFAQICAFAQEHELPLHRVQSVALGIRPSELIHRLLSRIGLPGDAVDVIREFTEWQTTGLKGMPSIQCQALDLANSFAHGLQLAPSMSQSVRPITALEWRRLSRGDPLPSMDPQALRSTVLTATNVLARLAPAEEKRLLDPLIPHRDIRIWYTRPPAFIEWDPLAAALTLSAGLTVSTELPEPAELEDYDALVIAGQRCNARPILAEEILRLLEATSRPGLPALALSAEACQIQQVDQMLLRPLPIALGDVAKWLECIKPQSAGATAKQAPSRDIPQHAA